MAELDNITDVVYESSEDLKSGFEFNSGMNAPAYMNRLFCSTKERVAYILKTAVGGIGLGKYDIGSDFHLYKIYGISPTQLSKANAGLGIYDMLNDPLSAMIIDNMRSRWGSSSNFV